MKMNRLVKGAVLLNKVTKGYFKVTEEGIAKELEAVDGEFKDNGEEIIITEENCLAFRVIKDGELLMPEGFTVQEGILLKNKEAAIEQGTLKFNRIIGSIPGFLILEEKEGLVKYEVARDRFCKFFSNKDDVETEYIVINQDDNSVTVSIVERWKETQTDNDGNEVVKNFAKSEIHVVNANDVTITAYLPFAIKKEDVIHIDDNYLFYVEAECNSDGLQEVKPYYYDYNSKSSYPCYPTGHKALKVTNTYENVYFFFLEDGTAFYDGSIYVPTLPAEVASKLYQGGYHFLIDNSYGERRNEHILTFSTREYQLRKVSYWETADRGIICKFVD